MAWPVDIGEENDSPESREENLTNSTDHFNESPNINAQGAANLTPSDGRRHAYVLPYQQNLRDMRERRPSNPFNRIRNSRRYSAGDISLSNVRASGSNEVCCLCLNRHLLLESVNVQRRNSFPQNCINHHFNPDTASSYTISRTILNQQGIYPTNENQTTNGFEVSEFENQQSFSVTRSYLFGNENFQADGYVQQAVPALGPEFFMRFLASEMDRWGLQVPDDMCRDMGRGGEMPPSFIFLMDRFSASQEREIIYHLAMRVHFPLNLSSFLTIVHGMNKGTASPERVVTLFFFCADLAIRAFRDGNATLFREIVVWTQWYLRRSDCLVVVPSKSPSYRITVTACVFGIITILILMKKNYNT